LQTRSILWISTAIGDSIRCCVAHKSSSGVCLLFAGTSSGQLFQFELVDSALQLHLPARKWSNNSSAAICDISINSIADRFFVALCDASGGVSLLDSSLQEVSCFTMVAKQRPICVASAVLPWSNKTIASCVGCADGFVRVCLTNTLNRRSAEVHFAAHSDWVKCISIVATSASLLVISGSQDCAMKIWTITDAIQVDTERTMHSHSLLSAEPGMLALPQKQSAARRMPGLDGVPGCDISLDSVISGHDDWVTGVQWATRADPGSSFVSCSADKSAVLWQREGNEWAPQTRVGGVGGKCIGMLGCDLYASGGAYKLLTYGHEGVLQVWRETVQGWASHPVPCGHFGAVTGFAFNDERNYLMSVSADQTARIWCCSEGHLFAEVGRPVCHGYDLKGAVFLPGSVDAHQVAISSAEKIIRVFSCTLTFLEALAEWTDCSGTAAEDVFVSGQLRPSSAVVPELGLSTLPSSATVDQLQAALVIEARLAREQVLKTAARLGEPAVVSGAGDTFLTPEATNGTGHNSLSQPVSLPVESHIETAIMAASSPPARFLSQQVLADSGQWVEQRKLYYHGNDVVALSRCNSLPFLLSSCIARTRQHAGLCVWDTTNWRMLQNVLAHESTINSIAVSPADSFVVTGGKDRQLAVYAIDTGAKDGPLSILSVFKAHKREVVAVQWTSEDCFFSASKDGTVKQWKLERGGDARSSLSLTGGTVVLKCPSAVTCMAAGQWRQSRAGLLVIADSSGSFQLLRPQEASQAGTHISVGRAFSCEITALHVGDDSVVCGGADGFIISFRVAS
jgi:elongator complex protein 2